MKHKPTLLNTEVSQSHIWQDVGVTVLACVGTTLLATPLLDYLDLANIVMLFLLTVLIIAVKRGKRAAVFAAVLSVLLFDVFFVPPRFSLAVNNIQYLITFAVMLATGLTTAHLAAGLKDKAREAVRREEQTLALYQFALKLAGSLTQKQVEEFTHEFLHEQLDSKGEIILDTSLSNQTHEVLAENHLLKIALTSGHITRCPSMGALGLASIYVPLKSSRRVFGVLIVRPNQVDVPSEASTQALLEALGSLIAIAIERLHYVDIAQTTEIEMMGERLRSSILSALSHDLRTPLTVMVGLADSLTLQKAALPMAALEIANALRDQAVRMSSLVTNLLDMARLHAGKVALRREWLPLEEIVGSSIKLLGSALDQHHLHIANVTNLPLLNLDAVLIERVLCNLLENAAKYSPLGSDILIQGSETEDRVCLSITDQGPGFPNQPTNELFKMFVRGENESSQSGVGLGLAICKAIVDSHSGHISAANTPEGGACVAITFPKGTPPMVEVES